PPATTLSLPDALPIFWGAADRLVPVEDGVEYAPRLRAPLRTIPDCGHLLIGERPDACVEAIRDFLDSYATAAPSKGTSAAVAIQDRKSTRLNSSHSQI